MILMLFSQDVGKIMTEEMRGMSKGKENLGSERKYGSIVIFNSPKCNVQTTPFHQIKFTVTMHFHVATTKPERSRNSIASNWICTETHKWFETCNSNIFLFPTRVNIQSDKYHIWKINLSE